MTSETNTRSRKWFLTINNPLDKGFTHDKIKDIIDNNINNEYYCLCDEIGLEEKTPHTHIFIACENAISFSKLKKLYPEANIQKALGTSQQCKDYIRKEGKYLNSDKEDTNLKETFEEFGIMPLDTKERNKKISDLVLEMIKAGATDIEIIEAYPSYMNKLQFFSKIRNMYKAKEQETYHKRHVEFIFGDTGTGKTKFYNRNAI